MADPMRLPGVKPDPDLPATVIEPFGMMMPPYNPGDELRWRWRQLENAGRSAFGVAPIPNPRPITISPHDPWTALPLAAEMISPVPSAIDLGVAIGDIQRAQARGDWWEAVKGLGAGALAAAAITPPGRVPGKAGRLPMSKAAREACAREMGYRPDLAAEINVIPPIERITVPGAAIRSAEGTVYGPAVTHADVMDDLMRGRFGDKEEMGFLTTSGRFMDRGEAAQIARAAGQSPDARKGLVSEALNPAVPLAGPVASEARFPSLESTVVVGTLGHRSPDTVGGTLAAKDPSTSTRRATKTAAPGGSGTLSATKATAWPRTTKLEKWDARGLGPRDVAVNLAEAWDAGRDAVIFRNYIPPEGGPPRDVIITRGANQWRLPKARFDPAQINSRDLMAGVLAPITFGALLPFLPPVEERP